MLAEKGLRMSHDNPYDFATLEAGEIIDKLEITSLPINPLTICREHKIDVVAKPAHIKGASGMFLRKGETYTIIYATHVDNIGFQNFCVAHELGHYFLAGHIDAVFADGESHESRAGFTSGDRYELEADHFAAGLLMPQNLFTSAMSRNGTGLTAIERLATLCKTSLTATAIRYTQCTDEPMAIVLSTGDKINYCFMSDTLKEVEGLDWIRKRDLLSKNTATFFFNKDTVRVNRADRVNGTSSLQDWFGGSLNTEITEEVRGLGNYGKTLTVLTASNLPDEEEIEEEENLIESWTPRF